jgi:hypothetical protein
MADSRILPRKVISRGGLLWAARVAFLKGNRMFLHRCSKMDFCSTAQNDDRKHVERLVPIRMATQYLRVVVTYIFKILP